MRRLTWDITSYNLVAGVTGYERAPGPHPLPQTLHVTRPWAGRIAAAYVLSPGDAPRAHLTGLRPSKCSRYFVGDLSGPARKRLVVAGLSEDRRRLHIAVANGYPRNSRRAAAAGFTALKVYRRAQVVSEEE